jgi:hypothetical protein
MDVAEFLVENGNDCPARSDLKELCVANKLGSSTASEVMEILDSVDKVQTLLPSQIVGQTAFERDHVNGSPIKDYLKFRMTPKGIFASLEFSVLKREPGTTAFTWVRKEEKAKLRPFEAVLMYMDFLKSTPVFEQKHIKIKHW